MSTWRTSSYSFAEANCVEVGRGPAVVGVRDTKLRESPVLTFPAEAWTRFTASLRIAA